MKAWPKALALVRVNSKGGQISKNIKADSECADRPLLVYSSQALNLAKLAGRSGKLGFRGRLSLQHVCLDEDH